MRTSIFSPTSKYVLRVSFLLLPQAHCCFFTLGQSIAIANVSMQINGTLAVAALVTPFNTAGTEVILYGAQGKEGEDKRARERANTVSRAITSAECSPAPL